MIKYLREKLGQGWGFARSLYVIWALFFFLLKTLYVNQPKSDFKGHHEWKFGDTHF